MQDIWLFVIGVAVGTISCFMVMSRIRDFSTTTNQRVSPYQEREYKQLMDYQLNHGRRIYNWLLKELPGHEKARIGIHKIENNNGLFSIQVKTMAFGPPAMPVLQLDFDFSRGVSERAEVFYGAQGPGARFAVPDHAPFYGLHKLVLDEIKREMEGRI